VAQGVGPEFKPQYHKKTKTKQKKNERTKRYPSRKKKEVELCLFMGDMTLYIENLKWSELINEFYKMARSKTKHTKI
jgi:hypothetical protein